MNIPKTRVRTLLLMRRCTGNQRRVRRVLRAVELLSCFFSPVTIFAVTYSLCTEYVVTVVFFCLILVYIKL